MKLHGLYFTSGYNITCKWLVWLVYTTKCLCKLYFARFEKSWVIYNHLLFKAAKGLDYLAGRCTLYVFAYIAPPTTNNWIYFPEHFRGQFSDIIGTIVCFLSSFLFRREIMNGIFTAYFYSINYSCLSIGETQWVKLMKHKSQTSRCFFSSLHGAQIHAVYLLVYCVSFTINTWSDLHHNKM